MLLSKIDQNDPCHNGMIILRVQWNTPIPAKLLSRPEEMTTY
jgi:hypothetical protein